jgi:hypothetical protein
MATLTAERIGESRVADPAYQAFRVLHVGFTVAPVLFGLDKFFNLMVDWPTYLAPVISGLLPGTADQIMLAVGVVEIAAGVLVALRPRIGGWVVAVWLWGIIANLLFVPGFYDVALRDFGLSLGAVALARLGAAYQAR